MSVTKAIFPVAGLGTRFLPATKAQPQGNAAGGGQTADPVRRGRGLRGRHPRDDLRHRPPQAAHRRPLRHDLRTRASPRTVGQARAAGRRAQRQARRHGMHLRAPGAGAGPGPCGAVRQAAGRQQPLRGAAGRRPDGRHAAGAQADGRSVRRVARLDPGGAGSAGRADAPLRHRRRHGRQRPRRRHQPDGGKASTRGRAVAPGRGRALHPHARRVPRDRIAAARRGRRDPADRRHRLAAAAREGLCLPLRGPPLRLRQQGRLPRRPTSNWRWPTRRWARASASSCAAWSSEQPRAGLPRYLRRR